VVVAAASWIRTRLKNLLETAGKTATTVPVEKPEALNAETIQEEEQTAKLEAQRTRPGLTVYTDRSRLDTGGNAYAVTWQIGQHWTGAKTHMGYNQEAYDAEFAAHARALEIAARGQNNTGAGYHLHRYPERHQTCGLGGTWPRTDIRNSRTEAHYGVAKATRYCHRAPEVRSTQRGSQQRKRRQMGQAYGGGNGRQSSEMAAGASPPHAAPETPRTPQAGNRGEKMGHWAGGRNSREKYKMPAKQKPDEQLQVAPRGTRRGSIS
jgi:hypothetical protein